METVGSDLKGRLVNEGPCKYGLEQLAFWRCADCQAVYPVIGGAIRCNGRAISRCPYCCKHDLIVNSKPETAPEEIKRKLTGWLEAGIATLPLDRGHAEEIIDDATDLNLLSIAVAVAAQAIADTKRLSRQLDEIQKVASPGWGR